MPPPVRSNYIVARPYPNTLFECCESKKQLWLIAKKSDDFSKFKMLGHNALSAIRLHRRNEEQRLIYSNDHKAFFRFVNNKCVSQKQPHNLLKIGATLTNHEAAEHFQREFCNDFSAACKPSTALAPTPALLVFNFLYLLAVRYLYWTPSKRSTPLIQRSWGTQ